MTKVTIVTTTYNDAHLYLVQQIRSVINSFYYAPIAHEFSQIIVNDGSTCPEAIKTLQFLQSLDIPGLTFINTRNQGLPAARNLALHHVDASHIVSLDADDLIHPLFISRLLDSIEASPNSLVSTNWVMFGARQRNISVRQATPYNIRYANYLPVSTAFPLKCFPVFQYDAKMTDGFEDWDFWIRLICSGYRHINIPDSLFYHREHAGNMTHYSIRNSRQIINYIKSKSPSLFDPQVDSFLRSKYPPSLFDLAKKSLSPQIRNYISSIL